MPSIANKTRNELIIGCALVLTLTLTRSSITRSHFGSELNLPDASWAVFWMMGLFTTSAAWPMVLLIACVGVDYFVIAGGVSAYCITPAYAFLLPAYLSMWAFGRMSRSQLPARVSSLPLLASSIVIGVTCCFVIANLSFYFLSGYFAQTSFMEFVRKVAHYWPHYLLHTALYAGIGVLIHYCVFHLQRHHATRADKFNRR